MRPPQPVRNLTGVLEQELGDELCAVIYVEADTREPVYLDPALTADLALDVDRCCDALTVHQSAHGCTLPVETDRVDMTVRRFDTAVAVTLCLDKDVGVIVVCAPPDAAAWPTLVVRCVDLLAPLGHDHRISG